MGFGVCCGCDNGWVDEDDPGFSHLFRMWVAGEAASEPHLPGRQWR